MHYATMEPASQEAYRAARRKYRAAWVAYQNADGPDFLPAMDELIAADREVKRLENAR